MLQLAHDVILKIGVPRYSVSARHEFLDIACNWAHGSVEAFLALHPKQKKATAIFAKDRAVRRRLIQES
jgi:hypothetical protein